MKTVMLELKAKTAREARREIAARWPDLDVYYWGYTANNQEVISGLVRKKSGGKPKKPGAYTPVRFTVTIPEEAAQ